MAAQKRKALNEYRSLHKNRLPRQMVLEISAAKLIFHVESDQVFRLRRQDKLDLAVRVKGKKTRNQGN